MLVFENLFLLSGLKLVFKGNLTPGYLSIFCYFLLVIIQRKFSFWPVILSFLSVWLHEHYLYMSDCDRKQYLPSYLYIHGAYRSSVCETTHHIQVGAQQIVAMQLEALKLHPAISYFLLGFSNTGSIEKSLMSATGLVHLLTISGLHIEVIASFIDRLIKLTRLPNHIINPLTAFIQIILLLLYGNWVGFAIPVQRAFIMRLVKIIAQIYCINLSGWIRWQLALLVTIYINAEVFDNYGFYLSYGLSAILIWAPGRNLMIAISTMGISLWFFHFFPWCGFFLNWVLVPVYELLVIAIICVGYISIIFHYYAPILLISKFLYLLDQLLLYWYQVGWVVDDSYAIAAGLIASLVFVFYLRSYESLVLIVLVIIMRGFFCYVPYGHFSVTIYPVQHGLMVLVRTLTSNIIYDLSRSGAYVRKYLEKDLHYNLFSGVYLAVVSHTDKDHFGGFDYLHQLLPGVKMISNYENYFRAGTCLAGGNWEVDGVKFIFENNGDLREKNNDASCVLRVISKSGFDILLPGDVSFDSKVVRRYRADIIVAPHHDRQKTWRASYDGGSILISDNGL